MSQAKASGVTKDSDRPILACSSVRVDRYVCRALRMRKSEPNATKPRDVRARDFVQAGC